MSEKFLGLDFLPFELEYYARLNDHFRRYPQQLSDYTFAALFTWSPLNRFEWAFVDTDTLLISRWKDGQRHLLQPIGPFSEACQQWLLDLLNQLPYRCRVYDADDQFMEHHKEFNSHFSVDNNRSHANYLYDAHDLSTLPGRKFMKKRNLIHQAEQLYRWTIEQLDTHCGADCIRILESLGPHDHQDGIAARSIDEERTALHKMMVHFGELRQNGIVIKIDGKPEAFSVWESLNGTTAVVHFEKANRELKGLYQVINKETANEVVKNGLHYINREEDLDIEGLRQAKLSYHPIAIVNSYTLTSIRNDL